MQTQFRSRNRPSTQAALLLVTLAASCDLPKLQTDPDYENGTTAPAGGQSNETGGTVAANGGTTSPVSYVSTGGTKATGGTTATGGTKASGGTTATGGTKATGGTTTKPTSTTGGTTTTTAPTTVITNVGKTVTFASGKAIGAMTGYGYVAMGSTNTVTSPTCGSGQTVIIGTTPCATYMNWSSATALCISGTLPALPGMPTTVDYEANWGFQIGVNATDPNTSSLGQPFTALTATLTGTPTTGLRVLVHKKGELDSVSYCAALTSGTAIALTSFVTDCYNVTPTGTRITAADVVNIDRIAVQVSSGAALVTVTNLCLTGITFS